MSRLSDILWDYDPPFQEPLARVRQATRLSLLVMAVWTVVRVLAVRLREEGLAGRGQQPETWPVCAKYGRRLQSKGFRERRRVGRCPHGCVGAQVAPLDQALGVLPHPRTGAEVQRMGCLLAVFVPYETACRWLYLLTGVSVAGGTLWWCVQQAGQGIRAQRADE